MKFIYAIITTMIIFLLIHFSGILGGVYMAKDLELVSGQNNVPEQNSEIIQPVKTQATKQAEPPKKLPTFQELYDCIKCNTRIYSSVNDCGLEEWTKEERVAAARLFFYGKESPNGDYVVITTYGGDVSEKLLYQGSDGKSIEQRATREVCGLH